MQITEHLRRQHRRNFKLLGEEVRGELSERGEYKLYDVGYYELPDGERGIIVRYYRNPPSPTKAGWLTPVTVQLDFCEGYELRRPTRSLILNRVRESLNSITLPKF